MLCTENLNSTFIIKSKLVISKLLVSPSLLGRDGRGYCLTSLAFGEDRGEVIIQLP